MQRYFIQLSYDGTNYHGWQIQPNGITVQEVLEKVISTISREKTSLTGAGRTDTGVHASFFVAHFDSENENLDAQKVLHSINSMLPADIAVQVIYKVKTDAHARFNALSRSYEYNLIKKKDPFCRFYAEKESAKPDIEKMNLAAAKLFDYIDFTSFSRLGTDVKTNNCKIMEARWSEEGNRLVFRITADRFLRNMVRAIVGTLLDVGLNKLTSEGFCRIIESKNRGAAGSSAPAKGLFLTNITYPEELSGGLIRK
jgi:tRNA pseudouridine38-40 synthase